MKKFITFLMLCITILTLSCVSCTKAEINPNEPLPTIEQGTNTDSSYLTIQGGIFSVINPAFSLTPGLVTFEDVYNNTQSYSSLIIKARVFDKTANKFTNDAIIMYNGVYTKGTKLGQLKALFPSSYSTTNKFVIEFEVSY